MTPDLIEGTITYLIDSGKMPLSFLSRHEKDVYIKDLAFECRRSTLGGIPEKLQLCTDLQKQTLGFICMFIKRYHVSPSYRDICRVAGISIRTVYERIKSMEAKGIISLEAGMHRKISPAFLDFDLMLDERARERAFEMMQDHNKLKELEKTTA